MSVGLNLSLFMLSQTGPNNNCIHFHNCSWKSRERGVGGRRKNHNEHQLESSNTSFPLNIYTYVNTYGDATLPNSFSLSTGHMKHRLHNKNWGTQNKQEQCIAVWEQLRIGHSAVNKPVWSTCNSSNRAVCHNNSKLHSGWFLNIRAMLHRPFQKEDSEPWQSSFRSQHPDFAGKWSSGGSSPPSSAGQSLSKSVFDEIWDSSLSLCARGVLTY